MKLKIFNITALSVLYLLLTVTAGIAQQAPPPVAPVPPVPPVTLQPDKDYQQKMDKLRQEMHDLQKQMSDLNTERIRKQALAMADYSKKWKAYGEDLNRKMTDRFKDFDKHFNFNFNSDDDRFLQQQIQNGEVKEKVKTYSKTYPADKNDMLKIDNRFGKVTVNTWNRNEFKVDVQIKAYANDDTEAQKLVDKIGISDSKEGDVVSFKTQISDSNDSSNNFWGFWKNEGKMHVRKMEINYTVYMPAKNTVDISNAFGSTELPDLDGKVILHNSYGNLVAKTLTNPANEIHVRYGSANIENLTGSDLNVAYGSLLLGTCDKLNADVSYSSCKIGKIKTSAVINARFGGGVQIEDLDKNVKNLSVNCSYSSVKLGLADNANADFDVTVHLGSFNYGNHAVNIVEKNPGEDSKGWNPTQTYKGRIGKGDPDKVIKITSRFASVKFD